MADRTALVCGRELTAAGCFLHLVVDEQLVRVEVPIDVASRARIDIEVSVPDGDLTDPRVSTGIRWSF
jgi:hypothetical protein